MKQSLANWLGTSHFVKKYFVENHKDGQTCCYDHFIENHCQKMRLKIQTKNNKKLAVEVEMYLRWLCIR